jgi:hypothetical protein
MTAGRIAFDPSLPWLWLAIVAAGAAIFWLGYVLRGGKAPVSRALGIALILIGIAQPMFVREKREAASDIVALIVDQSESLTLAGRRDAARAAGERLASQLSREQGLDVRVREVRGGGDGTALIGALEESLADAPRDRIAGALLVTDGQVSDVPEDMRRLRNLGPVHALIVGDPGRGDRRLHLLSAPQFGIVGDRATIEARVDDPQNGAGVPVTVSIDGQIVRRTTAIAGKPFKVDISPPKRGANMVVIEAAPGAKEITLANNRAAFELMGVRDRLRVLLVTGEPHAGARVWRNLLKSDPSVDLVHFTILRPPEKQDLTPLEELALIAFPTRELFVDKLDQFDLIIFDRYRRRAILPTAYFENIAQRVEAGGALLVVAGPSDAGYDSVFQTPLAAILPSQPTGQIVDQTYRPAMTALGQRHPVTRGLPDPQNWGRWNRQIDARAAAGQVVLSGVGARPLLVLGRAGQGRVAQLWSDQVWLWSRGYDGGGPHGELLRRLAHWLMQEPELDDERLTLKATPEGLAAERATLGAAPGAVEIIDPKGERRTAPFAEIAPGLFRATVATTDQGLYEARQGSLRAFAAVGPLNPKEAAAVDATGDILKPVADGTGGGVAFTGERAERLPEVRRIDRGARAHGAGWVGLERKGAYTVRASAAEPLGPGIAWAIAGLLLLLFSWRREAL